MQLAQVQLLKLQIMMMKITSLDLELVLPVLMMEETVSLLSATILTINQAQLTTVQFQVELSSSLVKLRPLLSHKESLNSESRYGELVELEELVLMITGQEDQVDSQELP